MKILLLIVMVAACSTGVACAGVSIQGPEVLEGQKNVCIAPDDGILAVAVRVPTLNKGKGKALPDKCFAVGKNKIKYELIIVPNEYANNYPEPSYFSSFYIWIKGKKGEKQKWKDGIWELTLTLQLNQKNIVYRSKFELESGTAILPKTGGEF